MQSLRAAARKAQPVFQQVRRMSSGTVNIAEEAKASGRGTAGLGRRAAMGTFLASLYTPYLATAAGPQEAKKWKIISFAALPVIAGALHKLGAV